MTVTITIEQLESLANQLEANEAAERERLCRLIRVYARIAAARGVEFKRRALEHSDEDGHWDSSFPPDQVYKDRTGPRLYCIEGWETDDIATSGGFYHEWRRVTTDRGLYVAPDGSLYGCEETGTGRLGQFAAHPGDCDVMCTLDWCRLDEDDVPIERLRAAEEKLRTVAFPLASAVTA